MRFIIDTNLLVSAILKPESLPGKALATAQHTGKLCFSDETRDEAIEVLMRDKFDRYLSKNERIAWLSDIFNKADFIFSKKQTIIACRDPKDDKFLELAFAADASCIITGDKDLLVLHPFKNIPILCPANFIKIEN